MKRLINRILCLLGRHKYKPILIIGFRSMICIYCKKIKLERG